MQNYKTKTKQSIFLFLDTHKDMSFTVSDVMDFMIENDISINTTTVYRNLDRLCDGGLLVKYKNVGDEAWRYQYTEHKKSCLSHIHLQCSHCGKIMHLECDFMREIQNHLSEEHGFTLDCSGSVLNGLCDDCRKLCSGKYSAGEHSL